MRDYADLLEQMKQDRRDQVLKLDGDLDTETAARLADTHICIQAIEAVMSEPEATKFGRRVEYGADGYPK